jgi:hypothetical protein
MSSPKTSRAPTVRNDVVMASASSPSMATCASPGRRPSVAAFAGVDAVSHPAELTR